MTAVRDHRAAAAAPLPDPAAGVRPDIVLVELTRPGSGGRARHHVRLPREVERWAGIAAAFVCWELAARLGWLDARVLVGPSTVLSTTRSLLADGTLPAALWASLQRVVWGLGIGVLLGSALAVAAGTSRAGDRLVDSNVQMLRFVPVLGLQPILIMWLGIGEATKVALIVVGVAFPVYVNFHTAIRAIDPGFHELADAVGLSRLGRLRRVVLPGALPGLLVGVRMASAAAWLLLVFAEQLNARTGIGFLMIRAQTMFRMDVIVVCLIVYAVLGVANDTLVRLLERSLLRWRPGR